MFVQEPPANALFLDTRSPQLYRMGHLPGALQLDLSAAMPALRSEADLAELERSLAKLNGQIGATPSTPVVLYDSGLTGALARTAFFLALGGLQVQLWIAGWENQATSTEATQPTPTEPWAKLNLEVLLTLNEAAEYPQLIDVRRPDEFAAGHIPRAQLYSLDRFMQPGLLEALGLQAGQEVGVYCRSGTRSAVAFWILRAQGIKARNYLGSMLEWEASGQEIER